MARTSRALRRARAPDPRAEETRDIIAQARAIVRPHEGPQTTFLSTPADIAIYGGAAGGGKTLGLLLEGLRHVEVDGFAGMFFRRTTVQVRNPGGLWDESQKIYPARGGRQIKQVLEWRFETEGPDGKTARSVLKMGHLEHEKTVLDHGGAQYAFIGFDELTLFTRAQFFFMLSRNRSTCGVRPYIRATCNPDADSWVAEFIAWWIDQTTGLPIPERAGKVRWFVRIGDEIKWGDSPAELTERFGTGAEGYDLIPKSVTFIPARVTDNPTLLRADPLYMANLMALPIVERERLLGGNWKIRPSAGLYFKREWCPEIDRHDVPKDVLWRRGWDLAATPKTQGNDPDWTSGTLLGRDPRGRYYLAHNVRDRLGPAGVEKLLLDTAQRDGRHCEISVPQDPGQAGKFQVQYLTRLLDGFIVRSTTEEGDKIKRFGPFSAQAQAGNVYLVTGDWNDDGGRSRDAFLASLEAFPDSAHDDDPDSVSRAYQGFHDNTTGLLEFYRQQAEAQSAAAAASAPRPGISSTPGTLMWGGAAPAAKHVRLRAPRGTTTVYGMDGSRYTVGADGTVAVQPADVAPLTRSGFVKVEPEEQSS